MIKPQTRTRLNPKNECQRIKLNLGVKTRDDVYSAHSQLVLELFFVATGRLFCSVVESLCGSEFFSLLIILYHCPIMSRLRNGEFRITKQLAHSREIGWRSHHPTAVTGSLQPTRLQDIGHELCRPKTWVFFLDTSACWSLHLSTHFILCMTYI